MSQRHHRGTWMAVLLVSFFGGLVSHVLFAPHLASARETQTLTADALYLVGYDGEQRLQLGSYTGAYSQAEKGLPLIGFTDNHEHLRLLFRLAGRNESPVLVFKDRQGRDRMVIGLGLGDAGEEPFVAYFNQDGTKHTLLGTY